MKTIKILNKTNGEILAKNCLVADNFFSRFVGLMGKKELNNIDGLCIIPCKSIHTFFMRLNIDAIFVNSDGIVVNVIKNLKPWKMTPYIKDSKYVIELPHKTIGINYKNIVYNEVEIGQKIQIILKLDKIK